MPRQIRSNAFDNDVGISARRGARRGRSRRTSQTPSSFIARSCDGLATPLPVSGAGARGSKRVTGACGLLSLLSRLARSYSQARPSHLRAAVASLRSSADSAGPIRCRSRGSTVWPSELRTKLVAFSGDVDTSALVVRSRNSSLVMRKPNRIFTRNQLRGDYGGRTVVKLSLLLCPGPFGSPVPPMVRKSPLPSSHVPGRVGV
jgi:hypothetical protein